MLKVVAVGAVVGFAVVLSTSRLFTTLLFQVSPTTA
jgi:hypothetical protein